MIQKYYALEKRDIDELIQEVNNRIKLGWKPIGGICISNYVYDGLDGITVRTDYVQAMVKEFEE